MLTLELMISKTEGERELRLKWLADMYAMSKTQECTANLIHSSHPETQAQKLSP